MPRSISLWRHAILALMPVALWCATAEAQEAVPEAFQSFARRIPITVDNTGGLALQSYPVVVAASALQAAVADINMGNCALAAIGADGAWAEIPFQVDEVDESVGQELCFTADIAADAKATFYLYDSPEGRRNRIFLRKTRVAEDWVPPNIGWESNLGAYRTYYGQFDFFGKKTVDPNDPEADPYILPTIADSDYHKETSWGIDALIVNATSGLGGLTLYAGDKAYPLQNADTKGAVRFEKAILCSGPVRAAVQLVITDFYPENPDASALVLCLIYGDHQESEIRVKLSGGPEGALLAPGLCRLPVEEVCVAKDKGYYGIWGRQNVEIGTIGLGVLIPPDQCPDAVDADGDHRLPCPLVDGALRYFIIGEWARGRGAKETPALAQWQQRLETLAAQVHRQAPVALGTAEALKQP